MPEPDIPDSFDNLDRVELRMAIEQMLAGRGDLLAQVRRRIAELDLGEDDDWDGGSPATVRGGPRWPAGRSGPAQARPE